jgi:hypothetical protein
VSGLGTLVLRRFICRIVKAIEYKSWLAENIRRGHTLGQFRNKFAMEHQDIILDTNLTPLEKSIRIWNGIYESAGKKIPEFFQQPTISIDLGPQPRKVPDSQYLLR